MALSALLLLVMVVAAQAAPAPPGFYPSRGPIWSRGQKEVQLQKHAKQHAGEANYLAEVDAVIGAIQEHYQEWAPEYGGQPGAVVAHSLLVGRNYATITRAEDSPSRNYRFLVSAIFQYPGRPVKSRVMVITRDTWEIVHYSKLDNEETVIPAPTTSTLRPTTSTLRPCYVRDRTWNPDFHDTRIRQVC